MTRLLFAAALMSTAIASEASALSCITPTVQGSFKQADASEAQYVMAVGRIQLLPGETVPSTGDDPNNRQGYSVKTRFDGKLASATGFDQDASFPLTVEVGCIGAWCGGVPLDRMLVFVERRDGENVLVEGPCPLFALKATPAVVTDAEACLTGNCEVPVD